MSKKKTGAEIILDMLKQYTEAHPETVKKIDETIDEIAPCIRCEAHYCNDCPNWRDEFADDYEEDEDEEEKCKDCDYYDGEGCNYHHDDDDLDYNEYYNPTYCAKDNEEEIDDCWNDDDDWGELDDYCEGHEICGCSDEDCYSCKGSKENQQIEDLSKLVKSVGAVLGGNMGILVFDKSNRKDMEKLSRIFGEYAKQLS